MASYAQRSQRYCSEDGFEYVTPLTIKNKACGLTEYNKLMDKIQDIYEYLQGIGVPNEDARMVLPNACTTCIEVKMNLRALMNFMNERLCTCAQWEIRELAFEMRRVIVNKYPELEPYLVPKCEKYGKELGFCNESKSRTCGRHPRLKEIFDCYNEFNGVQQN